MGSISEDLERAELRFRLISLWLERPAATGTVYTIAREWLCDYDCLGVIKALMELEAEGLISRHISGGYTFYFAKDLSAIKRAVSVTA